MRKILFSLLIVLLLILTGFVISNGKPFQNTVWGVSQIQAEDEEINKLNENLGNLINYTYPEAVTNLKNSSENLQQTKKKYEDEALMLAESGYSAQSEEYKIEFLWIKIQNYAKDNNVVMKMEVANSSTSGLYDLNFTFSGRYADVAQVIYSIENDSKLGFKIQNFSMVSIASESTDNLVQGSFSCKEIRIELKSIEQSASSANSNTPNQPADSTQPETTDTTTQSTQGTSTTSDASSQEITNNDNISQDATINNNASQETTSEEQLVQTDATQTTTNEESAT